MCLQAISILAWASRCSSRFKYATSKPTTRVCPGGYQIPTRFDLHSARIIPSAVGTGEIGAAVSILGRHQPLETADAGDVLVAAEVSRLARSTLQVLELLQAAAERGVTVHIAKNRMVLDQSLPATITATILGLAAQIEREFISARTKEALERRKAAGLPVGRPKGRATKLMLDDRRAEIVDYLNKGVSKRSVAKILGCSPTTLYSWIRRRRISGR